jgi:hypothetical protein
VPFVGCEYSPKASSALALFFTGAVPFFDVYVPSPFAVAACSAEAPAVCGCPWESVVARKSTTTVPAGSGDSQGKASQHGLLVTDFAVSSQKPSPPVVGAAVPLPGGGGTGPGAGAGAPGPWPVTAAKQFQFPVATGGGGPGGAPGLGGGFMHVPPPAPGTISDAGVQ